jgi:hypothetical protein
MIRHWNRLLRAESDTITRRRDAAQSADHAVGC